MVDDGVAAGEAHLLAQRAVVHRVVGFPLHLGDPLADHGFCWFILVDDQDVADAGEDRIGTVLFLEFFVTRGIHLWRPISLCLLVSKEGKINCVTWRELKKYPLTGPKAT